MAIMHHLRPYLRVRSPIGREMLAEFIGTFLLVTFAVASEAQYVLSRHTLSSYLTVNFASGMGRTFGLYFSGGVTGGHLNPAVSLALGFAGKMPWWKYPFYVLAQFAGALAAAAVQFGVYYDALNHFDGGHRATYGANATANIFATYPQDYVSTLNCFFDQVFGTFILVGSILAMVDTKNWSPSKGFMPMAQGLIVFAVGTAWALNCGYAINPARDLGPRIFTAVAGWGMNPFSYRNYNWFWVPIAGPLTGAVVAWLVYTLLIEVHWPNEVDQKKSESTDLVKKITLKPTPSSDTTNTSYDNMTYITSEEITVALQEITSKTERL